MQVQIGNRKAFLKYHTCTPVTGATKVTKAHLGPPIVLEICKHKGIEQRLL